MEYSNWLVVLLGMGVVFAGLLSIIILCYIMSAVVNIRKPKPVVSSGTSDGSEKEVVAAISAAIAAETGKDMKAIRILSIKKK